MSDEEIIPLEIFCSYYQVEQTFHGNAGIYGLISISYQGKPTIYSNGRSSGTGKISAGCIMN